MPHRTIATIAVALFLTAASPPSRTPDMALKTLDGVQMSLVALHGRVVVINFWATWCAPCRGEMPALDAYFRQRRASGLTMIAIAMDAGGPERKLREATRGYAFEVARIDDVRMPRSAIPRTLPETRVYDRTGQLRYDSAAQGNKPLNAAMLEAIVTPLLVEQGVTIASERPKA